MYAHFLFESGLAFFSYRWQKITRDSWVLSIISFSYRSESLQRAPLQYYDQAPNNAMAALEQEVAEGSIDKGSRFRLYDKVLFTLFSGVQERWRFKDGVRPQVPKLVSKY